MSQRGEMFNSSLIETPNRSWFDMSYDHIFSQNFGELVPSTMMELMAGDTVHAKTDSFARLSPLVAPTFGKVNQFSYHFYVRNRIIWPHWKEFITNKDQHEAWQNESPFTPPVMPYLDIRKILYKSNFFANSSSLTASTPTVDSDYNQTLDADYFNPSGVHTLVIDYEDQGGTISNVQDYEGQYVLPPLDAHTYRFICQYVPNKNEFHNTTIFNPLQTPPVIQKYYNPFSNGSLFDYLGVDLSGLYKQQWSQFQDFATWMNDIDSGYSTKGSVVALMTALLNVTDFYQYLDSNLPDLSFNFHDFVCSHAIIGWHLITADYYKASANAFGKTATSDSTWLVASDLTVNMWQDNESSKINALPLRAYYFVYSEYFRDQNYISINDNVDFTRDGEDIDWTLPLDTIWDYLTLKVKAWEHDPYTTALPQAQRGDPVRFLPDASLAIGPKSDISSGTYQNLRLELTGTSAGIVYAAGTPQSNGSNPSSDTIVANLSAATIENFRFANATQRFLEKCARTGNRYYEFMIGIFGVQVESEKLNRPEYLGGDKTPVQVSEVVQTSASDFTTDQPLGAMAGRAVALGSDDRIEFFAEEHGFFVEITTAIPRVSYQQGLAPMFTRKVQLDYPFNDYAQLGEEQIRTGELYYSASDTLDDVPFGYQSRYYQWKYNRDVVSGTFKDQLNHWTWSRIFDSAPVAGRAFLEVKPDYRQFAVTDSAFEHLYCTMYHDIQVQRELPIFGIPTL